MASRSVPVPPWNRGRNHLGGAKGNGCLGIDSGKGFCFIPIGNLIISEFHSIMRLYLSGAQASESNTISQPICFWTLMGVILRVWIRSKTFAMCPTIIWWQKSINSLRKFLDYILSKAVLNTLSASGTGVPPSLTAPLLDLSLLEDWASLSAYPFLIPLLIISTCSIKFTWFNQLSLPIWWLQVAVLHHTC